MNEIERMWEQAQSDPLHKAVNGTLLKQAANICKSCGTDLVSMDPCLKCPVCGSKECEDA